MRLWAAECVWTHHLIYSHNPQLQCWVLPNEILWSLSVSETVAVAFRDRQPPRASCTGLKETIHYQLVRCFYKLMFYGMSTWIQERKEGECGSIFRPFFTRVSQTVDRTYCSTPGRPTNTELLITQTAELHVKGEITQVRCLDKGGRTTTNTAGTSCLQTLIRDWTTAQIIDRLQVDNRDAVIRGNFDPLTKNSHPYHGDSGSGPANVFLLENRIRLFIRLFIICIYIYI